MRHHAKYWFAADEEPWLTISMSCQEWIGIWQGLLARWGPPLPDARAPQQQGAPTEASASSAHTLDLQLRRMLADAIAELDTVDAKSAAARELNAVRKQLLAR